MGHFLLLASLGLALIVAVGSFLLPRSKRLEPGGIAPPPRNSGPGEWFAMALPLIGFALTLPTHKPFAAGQGLGLGFLIGGAGSVVLYRALIARGTAGAKSAGLALVALTVAAPLLLLRPVLLDALMGVAIGWFATAFLLVRVQRSDQRKSPEMLALMAAAAFAAVLCSAALLGTLRDPRTPAIAKGTWSAIAVAFASSLSLLSYLVALVRGDGASTDARRFPLIPVITLALGVLIAVLLGLKIVGGKPLLVTLLIGLLIAPLIKWLQSAGDRPAKSGATVIAEPRFGRGLPFLVVLLIVTGFMVGTQLLLGYGAALVLVALWAGTTLFAGDLSIDDIKCLIFGAVLVLYRVYLATPSSDLHGVNVTDQYALFGFVVGAAAPSLIAAVVEGAPLGKGDGGRPIVESVVGGLLTLAAPAFVIIVFGPKCVLALILGGAIGSMFSEKRSLGPALIALGMALAVDQFNGLAQPYSDLSRLLRLKIVAVVFACLLAVVAISALRGRRDDNTGTKSNEVAEAPL